LVEAVADRVIYEVVDSGFRKYNDIGTINEGTKDMKEKIKKIQKKY